MQSEEYNLKVFGFGLAMLIPFIVMMHFYKSLINFPVFLLIFFALLFVISKSENLKPLYFSVLTGIYLGIGKGVMTDGLGWLSYVFLTLAIVLLVITLINTDFIKPVYSRWMKIVRSIRSVELLCGIFYYTAFTIGGIVLKLMRKDLLDRKFDPDKSSYWIDREDKEFNPKQYTKQF